MTDTRDIRARLERGERFLLDGANGTELKRRGITNSVNEDGTVNRGVTTNSAKVALAAPDMLREVHEDYLRAGADIVTTNTFNTNRGKLIGRGLGHLVDRAEELTRRAAEITLQARDRVKPEAFVAGSMSVPNKRDTPITPEEMAKEYRNQATVLADVGVDIFLLEYVRSIATAVLAVEAVSGFGLPVFLGIANVTQDGTMEFQEPVEQLVESLEGHLADAILTMCSRPKSVSATLPELRRAFDGPIGGYSNLVRIIDDYQPDSYAATVSEWLDKGAQIVGGCCGSTPDHIAALRQLMQPKDPAHAGR